MKRWTIYDEDVKSSLQLMRSFSNKVNEIVDNFNEKTDKKGDHQGSWQGIEKPTLTTEGVTSIIETQIDEVNTIKSTISLLATKEEVKASLSELVSTKPNGVYETSSELTQAFPNGDDNIYITKDDGNWNYWDSSKWAKGGLYQAVVIDKDGIKANNMTILKDLKFSISSSWEMGTVGTSNAAGATSTTRIRMKELFKIGLGTTIEMKDDLYQFYGFIFDKNLSLLETIPLGTSFEVNNPNACYIRLVAQYSDTRNISEIDVITNSVEVYNTSSLNNDNNDRNINKELNFTPGALNLTNGQLETHQTRVVTKDYIVNTPGKKVRLLNKEDVEIFVVAYNDDLTFNSTSSGFGFVEYEIPTNYFRIMARFKDQRILTEEDILKIKENIVYFTNTVFLGAYNEEVTLQEKVLLNFGDSIADASTSGVKGYAQTIAEKNKMSLINNARGGAKVVPNDDNNIITQINNALTINADYIFFNGLTNDVNNIREVGEITQGYDTQLNTNTFCGAFEEICRTLKNNWYNAKIVYVRPHNMASRNLTMQKTLGEEAIKICEKYSISVADVYKNSNFNTNINKYLEDGYTIAIDDATHPSTKGYDFGYVNIVENAMKNI